MSEEQIEEKPAAAPEKEIETPREEPGEDQTTEFVEMDEKVKKRFNRVYSNMKQFERLYTQMAKDHKVVLDRLEGLEGKQQEQAVAQAVENLKAKKVQALENADHKAVAEIDDQIAQVRAVPEKKPEAREEEPAIEIPNPDKELIHDWAHELTTDGNFRRPWAQPGHPYNAKATSIGMAVLEDPEFKGKDTSEILKEVDRLMGIEMKPLKRTSPVLSSDADVSVNKGKVTKLSADQKKIAEVLYANEEPAKAHARYLKGLGA